MNKAEKAYIEALEREAAFRWPTAAEPAPMTRDEIEAAKVTVTPRDTSVYRSRNVALGWKQNAYSERVDEAWSDGHTNGAGHSGDGGSQTMGRIYRTKADAALAMRWEMCRNFAAKLRAADLLIADALLAHREKLAVGMIDQMADGRRAGEV